MSTGIELLPLFLAWSAYSVGFKALLIGAEKLGQAAEIAARKNENICEIAPSINLQYENADSSIPAFSPGFDEETRVDELCGNFSRSHINVSSKTVMNDEELLLSTLNDYGFQFEVNDQVISASMAENRVLFKKDENGVYDAQMSVGSEDTAQGMVDELNDLYIRKVQQRVYENLTSRAGEKGLIFESEEFCEDNSIVLTFVIGE